MIDVRRTPLRDIISQLYKIVNRETNIFKYLTEVEEKGTASKEGRTTSVVRRAILYKK